MFSVIQLNNILIDKIIVHILDPEKPDLTLSDEILDPVTDKQVFDLVQMHILNILQNNRTRQAIFKNHSTSSACGLSEIVIKDPDAFIPVSKKLAEKLYEQLEKNKSTARCDLVICLYQMEHEPNKNQLAILKLGMSDGLRNRVEITSGKMIKVTLLERNQFAFEDLQKGAIIQSCQPDDRSNLLLLDNQTTPSYQKEIAIYFKERYLESEIVHDDVFYTILLYENLIEIENIFYKTGNHKYAEFIHKLQDHICGQKTYDLISWMKFLEFPKSLMNYLNINNLIDPRLVTARPFKIDQETMKKYCDVAKFKDDNGFALQVPKSSLTKIILPTMSTKPVIIELETKEWIRME